MTSKTTGSMPVKIMTEPTVMLLVLSFRAHIGAAGPKSSWLGLSTLGEGVTSNIRASEEVGMMMCRDGLYATMLIVLNRRTLSEQALGQGLLIIITVLSLIALSLFPL